MSDIINKNYREFDNEYEALEVSPYNAALDYYSAGWSKALKTVKINILDEFSKRNINVSLEIKDAINNAIEKAL